MIRTILCLLILSFGVQASSAYEALEQRNLQDTSVPSGKEYENTVVAAFWGSPHFMAECVPPGSQVQEPLTILFEVLPSGAMGELEFSRSDPVTECISRNVSGKRFPKPNKAFAARVDLTFVE